MIDQVVVALGMPGRVTGFLGRQREGEEGEEGGSEDSCTVLMHYEGMMATVKVAVVSCEERQLRVWVRGVEGSYKKVGLSLPVDNSFGGCGIPHGRIGDFSTSPPDPRSPTFTRVLSLLSHIH